MKVGALHETNACSVGLREANMLSFYYYRCRSSVFFYAYFLPVVLEFQEGNTHMPKDLADYLSFVKNLEDDTRKHKYNSDIELIGFGDMTYLQKFIPKFVQAGFILHHVATGRNIFFF